MSSRWFIFVKCNIWIMKFFGGKLESFKKKKHKEKIGTCETSDQFHSDRFCFQCSASVKATTGRKCSEFSFHSLRTIMILQLVLVLTGNVRFSLYQRDLFTRAHLSANRVKLFRPQIIAPPTGSAVQYQLIFSALVTTEWVPVFLSYFDLDNFQMRINLRAWKSSFSRMSWHIFGCSTCSRMRYCSEIDQSVKVNCTWNKNKNTYFSLYLTIFLPQQVANKV